MMEEKIKFKKEFKGKEYSVHVTKLKDVFLSRYVADYLFYNCLKEKRTLKMFFRNEGPVSEYDLKKVISFL